MPTIFVFTSVPSGLMVISAYAPCMLRSPEADTLLLLRRHVLRWNLGLHRHAGRGLGPFKLGVARCLPGLHLLGFDDALWDLAQPLVVAAAALVELGDDGAEGAVRPPAEADVVGRAADLRPGNDRSEEH